MISFFNKEETKVKTYNYCIALSRMIFLSFIYPLKTLMEYCPVCFFYHSYVR